MPALNSGHTVGYVRYPTLIRSIRIELSLKPVGRHDTGLAFTSPRAPVSDLSLYPDTFHQSPDSVHSALLPAVPLNIVKIVPGFEPRIFAISLKPVPFFHSSKTEAFSSAVNVRLIQKTSATPCFHITVALTN